MYGIVGSVRGNAKLVSKVLQDNRGIELIFSGDFIDGDDAREVVEQLKENKIEAVKGNHEDMFLDFLSKDFDVSVLGSILHKTEEEIVKEKVITVIELLEELETKEAEKALLIWKDNHFLNGGIKTWNSFSGENYTDLITVSEFLEIQEDIVTDQEELVEYLTNLPDILDKESVIISHAGIDNNLENYLDSSDIYLKWVGFDYIYDARNNTGKTVVNSHIPTKYLSKGNETSEVIYLGSARYAINSETEQTGVVNILYLNKEGEFIKAKQYN